MTEASEPLIAEPVDELDRWVPSLSISVGMLAQEIEGDIESTRLLGPFKLEDPDDLSPGEALRPSSSGSDLTLTPNASVSFEVMTPGLRTIPFLHLIPSLPEIRIPGAPRFFLHGEVNPAFGLTYRTAKEGDPKPGSIPATFAEPNIDITESVVFGQGSVLETQVQRWAFSAGAGIAFTMDLFDRRFRVKPSFEWMSEEVEIEGELRRAIAQVGLPFGTPLPPGAEPTLPKAIDDIRYEYLTGSKTKRFHALGVGIEFELDGGRAGPFLVSLFGQARGYRFTNNGRIRVSDQNVYDEEVTWEIKRDRYAYNAATGIRVRLALE